MKDLTSITEAVIGAAIEVHKHLGPGLLESAYSECLCYELSLRRVPFEREVAIPVGYKGLRLDCAYRVDLLVAGEVIVELKAVESLAAIHSAQLLSYLKAAEKGVGLLINFNVTVLKRGIKRIMNGYDVAGFSPCESPLSPCLRGEEELSNAEVAVGKS